MSFDLILKAAVEHHTPAGLIYVGNSDGDTAQLWPFTSSPNSIWISSSSNLQEKIKQHPQKYENIIPYFECVSKQAGALDYYEASLSEFSGHINPVVLKPYWQNIKTVKTAKRPVTTLDELCRQNSKAHNAWASANWLIVDQLAALDVLKGGKDFLPQLDGMIIKVFLPDQSSCAPELATSSKEKITEWLRHHNFTAVVQKDGRHKSFAHIMFARNWKVEYESLSIKREEARCIVDEFSSLNDKLEEQLTAKQQTIVELTEEHIRVQESQEKRVSEMAAKLKDLQAQKDDAKAEHTKQLDEHMKQLDEHTKQLDMLQTDLEAKLQSNKKLSEENDLFQEKTMELEAKITASSAKITQLDAKTKELKSELLLAQDTKLQKEKQAELHLQDLEFLREKFKDMKRKHDGNIELLKNVQAKLLAAVQDSLTQQSDGNTSENLK